MWENSVSDPPPLFENRKIEGYPLLSNLQNIKFLLLNGQNVVLKFQVF